MSGSISDKRTDLGPSDDLVLGWLKARSVARGLPEPVPDGGGWRVDTRSAAEECRYVFAAPGPAIGRLARSIDRPRVFIKLCDSDSSLARLLPTGWVLQDQAWFMTGPRVVSRYTLPTGYRSTIERQGGAFRVAMLAADGTVAASGYGAEAEGVFGFDRIVTDEGHQRRGLGRAVMGLLAAQRSSDQVRPALVATDAGRALYSALGWRMLKPYATAVMSDRAA